MHAIWYERTGPGDQVLTFGEIDTPRPGREDVLVRVRTSGVNPSDTKRRSGNQPMAFPRVIPHSDGAGIIEAVGSAVPASRVGERVWLWNAQFGRPFGTAAEYVALPSRQAVRLPDAVDPVAGACLGIPALTAHRCLFSDGPVQGLTVLVSGGAGAVGNAAIQLAKWGGATVITTVSSPEKADVAREAGADHVIDYRKEDVAARISGITQGAGVDRVVEVAFGHNISVDSAVIQQNGVIAAYSSDANPYPQIPFFELMRKDITLRLTLVYIIPTAAREQGIADVNAALQAGALRPAIAKRFALRETALAHQAVESGQLMGNVVVEVD